MSKFFKPTPLTAEEKDEKIRGAMANVLAAFESGAVPAAIAKIMFPTYEKPMDKWSFNNQLMALFSGTMDARGFKQWNDAGRKVNAGAKAVYILGPCMVKVKEKKVIGGVIQEVETPRLVGFKAIPVFRYEDTNGKDLVYPKLELPKLRLMDVALKWGLDVKAIAGNPTYYGYYSSKDKAIRLATPEESTFWHELTHAAHDRVLARENKKIQNESRAKKEVIAEFGAAVIGEIFGARSMHGTNLNYVTSYAAELGKPAHKAAIDLISEIEKVMTEIFKDAIVTA